MAQMAYVSVPHFFAGKSVLITGASGYLGKVLLEKLLHSCPNLEKVYVLMRDKRNVSAEQRLRTISELPIFDRLRNERPQDLEKIALVKGDLSNRNLEMKTEDLDKVIEKVSVVIHSAATVKFNEPLKVALEINLEGTRNVIDLCHRLKNTPVLVYMSTAFCHTDQAELEEKVYPPPLPLNEVYKFVEQGLGDAETANFLNKYGRPNTYTLTKALAEHLVSETHGDIPAVIVRPSIVTPSKDEPVKGWVENWYGATGLLTTVAKGLCRALYTYDDIVIDLIPVDYACNLTLVAAARAKQYNKNTNSYSFTQQTEVEVYNSCSGSTNPITIEHLINLYTQESIKNRFYDFPYPQLMLFTQRYWLVKTINLMIFLLANAVDMQTRLTGILFVDKNRPNLTDIVTKSAKMQSELEFFMSHSWVMKTERSRELYESLSPSDSRLFPCLARDINWEEYIPLYFQGVKKYLVEKPKVRSRL